MTVEHARMSVPQRQLLAELAGKGLYVTAYRRYHRTVMALVARGLAECDDTDYSRRGQHHYVLTDEGRKWLDDHR